MKDNIWLTINPTKALSSRPTVLDNYLQLPVALEASPAITVGPKPPDGNRPLPELEQAALNPALTLNLRDAVSFLEVSRRIHNVLVGQMFTLGTRWPYSEMAFEVTDVQVTGSGDQIIIAVSVGGFARGTLFFFGTPAFKGGDSLHGHISIENIDYSVETANLLVHLGNLIFHNQIREKIQAAAKWDVSSQLQRAYQNLNLAMNRNLSADTKLEGSVTQFGPGTIWVSKSGIEALYSVSGNLSVVASPF